MIEEMVVIKEMLTKEMIDAGAELLKRLDEANLDVQAALWVYLWESNRWWLVFALPGIQEEGPLKSYQKIHGVLSQIPDNQPGVHWSDISVVATDDRFISRLRTSGLVPFSAPPKRGAVLWSNAPKTKGNSIGYRNGNESYQHDSINGPPRLETATVKNVVPVSGWLTPKRTGDSKHPLRRRLSF